MSADLFASDQQRYQPLAARLRPRQLADFIGQSHILGPDKPLREAIEQGHLHSMIFWGPPGVGKTSLARLLAEQTDAHFTTLSAVLAGVKDIRAAVAQAEQTRAQSGRDTILFVDEVHRFNKAQQDAFLPYVEDGTVIFIGATTENPSFELNNALLSRCRVYKLRNLEADDIAAVIDRALASPEGLGEPPLTLSDNQRQLLIASADGDARRALNLLEIAADLADVNQEKRQLDDALLQEVLAVDGRRFDKGGDYFYDQVSALHKSVRGSSPDGALYWFARMLDGGCDPQYIARRIVRMASEDIGNADPRALTICRDAWDVYDRLGSPEGELALAQALVYLASAPKSNAVYSAFNQVMADVRQQPSHEVPLHLRNAPTQLMKAMDHGKEYRYAHDEPDAYAAGENYFPEPLKDSRYYQPTDRGLEAKIRAKLEHLRSLDAASAERRYANNPKPEEGGA